LNCIILLNFLKTLYIENEPIFRLFACCLLLLPGVACACVLCVLCGRSDRAAGQRQ
jgi:hypothetical protein